MTLRILAALVLLLFAGSTALACPDVPFSDCYEGCCGDDCDEGSTPDMLKSCCTFTDELVLPGPAVDMPSPTAIPGSPYLSLPPDSRAHPRPSIAPHRTPRTRLFLTHQALLL